MIPILTADSYRGVSADLSLSGLSSAQPVFIGRLLWPGDRQPTDAVLKLYESATCGIANEIIGYIANQLRSIDQPKRAAVVLLSKENLAGISTSLGPFVDKATELVACWATSLEQNTVPFKYIRQLPTFTPKQTKAFLQSKFCKRLSSVDHATGNNDRHEGNFLYIDDLRYLAIDQGCVGGSVRWHSTWPNPSPRNELLELAHRELQGTTLAEWTGEAILEHSKTQSEWASIVQNIRANLAGLLDDDASVIIVDYMNERVSGNTFTANCGRLI